MFLHWIDRPAGLATTLSNGVVATVRIHPMAVVGISETAYPDYSQKNLAIAHSLTPHTNLRAGEVNPVLSSPKQGRRGHGRGEHGIGEHGVLAAEVTAGGSNIVPFPGLAA